MSIYKSLTDTPYDGTKTITSSSTSVAISSILCFQIIMTPAYGLLNPNGFMENKTASKSIQTLNTPIIGSNNTTTNDVFYKNTKIFESPHEINIQYEDEIEELLDWNIWIENPPISKTITINATFIQGNYIFPSIEEDVEN